MSMEMVVRPLRESHRNVKVDTARGSDREASREHVAIDIDGDSGEMINDSRDNGLAELNLHHTQST
jgi:hypothetical protein